MTIQDLLNAGFEMKMPIKNYLYGMNTLITDIKSTLQPDYLFTNGSKSIAISYNGGLVEFGGDMNSDDFDKLTQLANVGKIHFIQLKEANNIVYENYFGIFPSNEVLNTFIS